MTGMTGFAEFRVVAGEVRTPGPGRVDLRAAALDRKGLPGCALAVATKLKRNTHAGGRLTVITALRDFTPRIASGGPCVAFSRAGDVQAQVYPLFYFGLRVGSGALEVGEVPGSGPRERRIGQIIPIHRSGRRSCVWSFSLERAEEQAGLVAVVVDIDGDWVGTWSTEDLPMTFAPYALGADVEYQVVGRGSAW